MIGSPQIGLEPFASLPRLTHTAAPTDKQCSAKTDTKIFYRFQPLQAQHSIPNTHANTADQRQNSCTPAAHCCCRMEGASCSSNNRSNLILALPLLPSHLHKLVKGDLPQHFKLASVNLSNPVEFCYFLLQLDCHNRHNPARPVNPLAPCTAARGCTVLTVSKHPIPQYDSCDPHTIQEENPSNTAYHKQPHPTTQQDRQHTAVFTHTLHYFRSDTAPCFHAAACPAARPGDPDCMSRPHQTRSCVYTPFTATQPCTPPHSHDPACRIAPPTAPQSFDCASSQNPCVGQLCVTAAAPQQSS